MFLLITMAALTTSAQPAIAANDSEAALPNAPQPAVTTPVSPLARQHQQDQQFSGNRPTRQAHRLAKYIQPDERSVTLSAKEKLELSGWEQLQPYAFGTQILAAGWEQLLNSDPKYGTDKAGFGERLGAATIRQGSQAILSDGVFAAVFRQDPRYYVKGSGKILNRVVYAASRVLITRNDDGSEAVNYSELVGYAGASALTMTYYPAVSATWPKTAKGYGISLAGTALGNAVHEFLPDLMHLVSHRHGGQTATAIPETENKGS
ncbi:MAG: hypothetical protein WA708_07505 [Acidobacteriaceae bacterium]